jgi:hypothetical protein
MNYQRQAIALCLLSAWFARGSQQSTSTHSLQTTQVKEAKKGPEVLEKYEKEFIAQYGSDEEASLTGSSAFVHFSVYPAAKPYVGIAALLSKQRNVVIIPQIHLEKRLKRLLHARAINFIVDPFGAKSYWIVYSPAGKNNATLLYYSRKDELLYDYAQLHLLGYKDDAIKEAYKQDFEMNKDETEDWLKEQAGTSSWKQLEETFKSLDEDDVSENGGLYLKGFMARKSDEAILKDYYDRFEQHRKETLDWIKQESTKLKLFIN